MSKPAAQPANATPDPEHTTPFVQAWRVTSRRHPHVRYVVTYDRLENQWSCQCPGFWKWRHCWHIDQAINAFAAEARKAKGRRNAA